jgi:nitrile hydratase
MARQASVTKTSSPAIATGAPVRLKSIAPPGHVRCPWYLRGKTGVIERDLGLTGNPETLAYGVEAQQIRLYRVRFTMKDIWGDDADPASDTLDAEIFENWLEPTHAS